MSTQTRSPSVPVLVQFKNHFLMHWQQFVLAFVVALLVIAPTIDFVSASVEIAIDTDPLFNSMNDFLPTAMQIIGIPAGIGLAFLIVTFIVSAFFRYIRGTV
jgi:uncharacterized membrane protein